MTDRVIDDPQKAFGMYVAHVGINAQDEQDAQRIAEQFSTLMGLPTHDMGKPSYFAGSLVEVMKGCGRGSRGHIGFHVDDLPAAEAYFVQRGFEINEESRVCNPDGSTFLVYFKQEIAGFAIHLTTQD